MENLWVIRLVGLVIGFVVTLHCWRGEAKPDDEQQDDVRLKGFLSLVGGCLAGFLADWEFLLDEKTMTKSAMFFSYLSGFLPGMLATLAFGALAFVHETGLWRRTHQLRHAVSLPAAALDYLSFGMEGARSMRQARFSEVLQSQSLLKMAVEAIPDYAHLIATAIRNTVTKLAVPRADRRGLVQELLMRLEVQVAAHARGAALVPTNSNVMRLEPYGDGDPSVFFVGAHRPDEVLRLWVYRDHTTTHTPPDMALPLVARDAQGRWRESVLPGAPECLLSGRPVSISPTTLSFAEQVPDEVRKDIERYIGAQDFRSFISIPLPALDNGHRRGVINVEFDSHGAVELDGEQLERMAKAVMPYATLIAWVLEKEA